VVLHGGACENELVLSMILEQFLEESGVLALDPVAFVDDEILPLDLSKGRFLEHHLECSDQYVELEQL